MIDDTTPLTHTDIASAIGHLAGCVADCETLEPRERPAIRNQLRSIRDTLLALGKARAPGEGRPPKDDVAEAGPMSPNDIASLLRPLAVYVEDCKEELSPDKLAIVIDQLRVASDRILRPESSASPTPELKGAGELATESVLTIEDWIRIAAMSPLAPPYTIDPYAVPRSPIPPGEHGAIRGWAAHVLRCARAIRDVAAEAAGTTAGAPSAVDDARAPASPKDRTAAAPSDFSPTPASKPWCFGLHVIGANQRQALLDLLAALDERLTSDERAEPLGVKLAAARAALEGSR